ncbi:glycosyltransferase family 4 protein [Congregibacter variabilis]|uniref:Glycosyltransferase family 4 protein n=1 Tax=Congregibacter variabilis TaxID=3081200 RepID=A0ABZ0I619_9GAMM|nr:glycosyltransferase family 4 protein [Congregibacter sp. IMCC43200]
MDITVRLVTATRAQSADDEPFEVFRKPSISKLIELYRWADGVMMVGPSIRSGWLSLLVKKPLLVSHHAGPPSGTAQWFLTKRARNVACSEYLAQQVGGNSVGVQNPFDVSLFNLNTQGKKNIDFVYVGRLVAAKGVDVFLRALAILKRNGRHFTASIIGSGPDESALKNLARELEFLDEVKFTGSLAGSELRDYLQRHKIGIVPSRWQEPFGIVALEMIACKMPVIGSRVGGLPEAVGPCGLLFNNGDAADLASKMDELLADPNLRDELVSQAADHLSQSDPKNVARLYVEELFR